MLPIPSAIDPLRWLPTPRLWLRLRLSGRGYRIHATSTLATHRARAVHRADDGQEWGVKLFHSREGLSHHANTTRTCDLTYPRLLAYGHPVRVSIAGSPGRQPQTKYDNAMAVCIGLGCDAAPTFCRLNQRGYKRLQGTSLGVRLHQSCRPLDSKLHCFGPPSPSERDWYYISPFSPLSRRPPSLNNNRRDQTQ
jgi:hypothetical protein